MNDPAELLSQRIDADIPGKNKYNFWPKGGEIVRVQVLNPNEPVVAWNLGYLAGAPGPSKLFYAKHVPPAVPIGKLNPYTSHDPRTGGGMLRADVRWAAAKGQVDNYEGRNYLLVFSPRKKWDSHLIHEDGSRGGYVFAKNAGIIVEVGCQHDYERTKLGNCYYRSVCKRCGHKFEVDSGD